MTLKKVIKEAKQRANDDVIGKNRARKEGSLAGHKE